MINCKLNLYILVLNKQTIKYQILSLSEDKICIPHKDVSSESKIEHLLCDIFKQHIDLDPGFTNFILSDIENNSASLNINYFCLVPYSTKIISGNLLTINYNEISSTTLRHILSKL
jgi:hypothetical protein